jgi:hypothetical protein
MCEIPGDVIFFSEVQLIISSCASVITKLLKHLKILKDKRTFKNKNYHIS